MNWFRLWEQKIEIENYLMVFFLLIFVLLRVEKSQSLPESLSADSKDSSNSDASSILVIPLVPNDDGNDDAVSLGEMFGLWSGV